MTTPTHIAIGYFIARGFATFGLLPDTNSTYLVSMVLSNAPDIDGLYNFHKLFAHREKYFALSHYPVTWFVLYGIAYLFTVNYSPQLLHYIFMSGICVASHFVLDTFDYFDGIAWLGPWIKRKFSFVYRTKSPLTSNAEWSMLYKTHWLFYIELGICILAFALAFVT